MSELYELLTFEAFGQRYPELTSRHQILPGRGIFCKAERLQSGVIGTYAMPQRMAPTGEKHFFGYYLTEKKLLLVEKGGFDVIYADHCMERMTPKFAGIFVDTVHFAVSGRLA